RAPRPLRLRCRRAHRGAARDPPRRRGFRVHAAGRRARAGLRAQVRRRLGGRIGSDAAGRARCRDHLRAGGRAGAGRAARGGAGIHMSDIPGFPYELLWREREIVSVANLTRADGEGFFAEAETAMIAPVVEVLPLAAADAALARLRGGEIEGAFVLKPER